MQLLEGVNPLYCRMRSVAYDSGYDTVFFSQYEILSWPSLNKRTHSWDDNVKINNGSLSLSGKINIFRLSIFQAISYLLIDLNPNHLTVKIKLFLMNRSHLFQIIKPIHLIWQTWLIKSDGSITGYEGITWCY